MQKILVIQTAFIGDAILGTALLERLHSEFPKAKIDYLVRKGNESLFANHPFLNEVLVWDKSNSKYSNLWQLLQRIRNSKYDSVFNVQRFGASGFLTAFSGAKAKVGYDKNPFSILFSKSAKHRFGKGFESVHEVDRVIDLFEFDSKRKNPKLYPSENDFDKTSTLTDKPFVTIAPASVWFTKQFPAEKWIDFINQIPESLEVILIGGPTDSELSKEIASKVSRSVIDQTGKLKLLETAALMKYAKMNYSNDSAPVHLASAVNAPICEVYCSTIPSFGFSPLSDSSFIIETDEKLDCRPCGIHGKSACPKGHFKCAKTIQTKQLLAALG